MMKKVIGFLFSFLVIVVFIPEVTALAAPNLKVSVTAGIDGKVKSGRGGPIAVTIENTGTSFSGDLVIDVMESYDQGTGRAISLELDSGETKTVSFVVSDMDGLSGMYGSPNKKSIYFYEGGWEKGKEISHTGAQKVTAYLLEDDKFIVTFTNNKDRLASLKGIEIGSMTNTKLIDSSKVNLPNLPDDVLSWDSVDYMVFDEYALADLKSEKQDALLAWVRKGGVIVIGSSDNIEVETGVFSSYLPLEMKESSTIDPKLLNEWADTEGFVNPIPAYSTALNDGAKTLFVDNENVIIASKEVGEGLILQTAFSLGDDPFAQSTGMPFFWSKLLSIGENSALSSSLNMYNPMDQLLYSVTETNELFPSFKVSTSLIFGIIILYIIIIIPIMYFVLKRKDKRELAWWIIPVIALITSVGIFGYGAKDRVGRAQIQHTALLNVEEDGSLQGYYSESVLSNKSGDFTFTAPNGTTLSATSQNLLFDASGSMVHKHSILEEDVAGTTINLRNVGYWNVATIYGQSRVKDIGQFTIDLAVDNKKLTGTVTNDFPFELKDLSVWSGNTFIPIGDLGPGETIQVNEQLKTTTLVSRYPTNNMMNQPQMNTDDLMEMRKNSLLSFNGENMQAVQKPALIGYANTQIIPITLEDENPTNSALTMIMQPIDVEFNFTGKVVIEEELLGMTIKVNEEGYGTYIINNPSEDSYYEGNEYLQTWKLTDHLQEKKMEWESIKVSNINQKLYTSELLNVKTGKFEQVDVKDLVISEKVNDYISADGTIVNRVEFFRGGYGEYTDLPKIELTGEVGQ